MNNIINNLASLVALSCVVFLGGCSSDTRIDAKNEASEIVIDSLFLDQEEFRDIGNFVPNSVLNSYKLYSEANEIIDNYLNSLSRTDSSFNYNENPEAVFWESYFGRSINMEPLALAWANEIYMLPSVGDDIEDINKLREEAFLQLQRAIALMSSPRIQEIVDRRLTIGDNIIPVKMDYSANRYIGMVTCDSDGLVIIMARNPDSRYRINPYAFLFFREHEFAHIAKGHVECVDGRPTRTGGKDQEYEADCEAVRILKSFPEGGRVVDRAWSILNGLPMGETSTHPAPSERARHIDEVCSD